MYSCAASPRLCCVVQSKKIPTRRDRAEAERDFGVMPQPPARRKDGRDRHRAEQQRERQQHEKFTRRHRAELCGRSGGGQTQTRAGGLTRRRFAATVPALAAGSTSKGDEHLFADIAKTPAAQALARRVELGGAPFFPASQFPRNRFSPRCCKNFFRENQSSSSPKT